MKPDTPDSIFVFPDHMVAPNDMVQPDLTICTDLEVPNFEFFQEIYHPQDDKFLEKIQN